VLHSTTRICVTGWRRPIGCLKLQVIFRERAANYRALLRKITYKDKASYGSSLPCTTQCARYVTGSYVACLVHLGGHDLSVCGMTHAYVAWLMGIWHCTCLVAHPHVTWLVHMWYDSSIWDMTYSYGTWLINMWHDSFIYDGILMTHSSKWDKTHTYSTWLVHEWHYSSIRDMTHSYATCIFHA